MSERSLLYIEREITNICGAERSGGGVGWVSGGRCDVK